LILIYHQVITGKALFGIGATTIQQDRNEVVDFTAPTYPLDMQLMTTKPKLLPSYMNFVSPFKLEAWLVILGSVVASSILLAGITGITGGKRSWEVWSACYRILINQEGTLTC
jgi:hypothetical protein